MRNRIRPQSDYKGEMRNHTRFTDRDADAALSGLTPASDELASVQRALSLMKETLTMEPSPEVVSAQAAMFAAAVPSPDAAPQLKPTSPWRRRVAAVVAVAAISGFGVAGAAAADEAAPGDSMYGVDKALERAGILDGGTQERLDEAQVLLGHDDIDGALKLVGDSLEGDGEVEAATGLRNAALAVASNSSGDDVRARVSEMLQWMAGEESRGAEFGAQVSERARQLSGNANVNKGANENANENANKNANENANENANKNANKDANKDANENANKSPDASATGDQNGDASTTRDENAKAAADPVSQSKAPETPVGTDRAGERP